MVRFHERKKKKKRSSPSFLAKSIARALGEFCEVDESQIESRLLKKARISLNNVRLIPRVILRTDDYKFEIRGEVESCTFSWNWTMSRKNAGLGNVKNSALTMKGLNIQIVPHKLDCKEDEIKAPKPQNEEDQEDPIKNKKKWKMQTVDQIIDQCAVNVLDLRVQVEIPRSWDSTVYSDIPWKTRLVVCGDGLALKSLGRGSSLQSRAKHAVLKKAFPLFQTFQARAISAHMVVFDESGLRKRIPLVDPFKYAVKMKQHHGKRFHGGLAVGYDIVGEKFMAEMLPPIVTSCSSVDERECDESNDEYSTDESDHSDNDNDDSVCSVKQVEVRTETERNIIETSLGQNFKELNFGGYQVEHNTVGNEEDRGQETSGHIHFHIGRNQMMAIASIVHFLKTQFMERPVKKETTSIRSRQNGLMYRGRLAELKKSTLESTLLYKSLRNLNKSTNFDLPMDTLTLQLDNAAISLKKCRYQHEKDVHTNILTCKGGATADNSTIVNNDCVLTLDLEDREIHIEPRHVDGMKARPQIQLPKGTLQIVNKSISEIADIWDVVTNGDNKKSPVFGESSGWSVSLKGEVTVSL